MLILWQHVAMYAADQTDAFAISLYMCKLNRLLMTKLLKSLTGLRGAHFIFECFTFPVCFSLKEMFCTALYLAVKLVDNWYHG